MVDILWTVHCSFHHFTVISLGIQSITLDASFKQVLLHAFHPSYFCQLRLLRGENISPLLSADFPKYALDFSLLQIEHNAPRTTRLG